MWTMPPLGHRGDKMGVTARGAKAFFADNQGLTTSTAARKASCCGKVRRRKHEKKNEKDETTEKEAAYVKVNAIASKKGN